MKKVQPQFLENISENTPVEPDRRFELVLAEPGTVFCVKGKEMFVVGYGTKFAFEWLTNWQLQTTVPGTMTRRKKTVAKPVGEVFTNFDKRPELSPIEQILTVKMRELQRAEDRAKRERAAADRAMLAASGTKAKNPPPEETVKEKEEEEVEKKTEENSKKDEEKS
jgi:hypothetical protein